jgi:hypothetical protein
MPTGGLTATGLTACVPAVNAHVVETLIVPDNGLVPGYECRRCGALSVADGQCPDCGTAVLPVPDLIEEMVVRTLEDGGQVYPVHVDLARVAARLRFPVARWLGRSRSWYRSRPPRSTSWPWVPVRTGAASALGGGSRVLRKRAGNYPALDFRREVIR